MSCADSPQRLQKVPEAVGRNFVPQGVSHVEVAGREKPIRFYFALVPNFSLLSFTSAIEPLRVANQLSGRHLFEWEVVSPNATPISSSSGLSFETQPLPDIDRRDVAFVCGGGEPETQITTEYSNWIGKASRHGAQVGGLCTGAFALAAAGLLSGRNFTLHWENIACFQDRFPRLEPVEQLWARDLRIMTSGGGVSSAELMLAWIRDKFGQKLAVRTREMMLLPESREPTEKPRFPAGIAWQSNNPRLVDAINHIAGHYSENIAAPTIAHEVGISVRQLERHFKNSLNITPAKFLAQYRAREARRLLLETDSPLPAVAAEVGLGSAQTLTKIFLRTYGCRPRDFRLNGGSCDA